jgi:hypothetical protein
MIAHVAGAPVEETLLPVLGAVGAGLLLARAWVASHVGRARRRRPGWTRGSDRPPA